MSCYAEFKKGKAPETVYAHAHWSTLATNSRLSENKDEVIVI